MKLYIQTWKLKDLIEHCNTCKTCIDNKWVPARPINYQYRTILERLVESWNVFTGKSDSFNWTEGQ